MTEDAAPLPQGDPELLLTATAQQLLNSQIPARMAFVGLDGTPRVIPTWFHWNGDEIVMVTFVSAPHVRHPAARIAALRANPAVALTIDTESFPPHILTIRGTAVIDEVEGIAAEYRAAAQRYLGHDAGVAMVDSIDVPGTRQARITLAPKWVGLIDFDTRPPSVFGGVATR